MNNIEKNIDIQEQQVILNSFKENNNRQFSLSDYQNQQANRFNSRQSNSGSCCGILKHGVKIGLGLTALGVAGYEIYRNAGLIQNYAADFQPILSRVISSVGKSAYLKPVAVLALFGLLLKLNLHKYIASAIMAIVKFPFNSKLKLIIVSILLANIVYDPQGPVSMFLMKALYQVGKGMAQVQLGLKDVPFVIEAMDFIIKYGKMIAFLVFDFAVLGFIHKAYEQCCKKKAPRFYGGGRLGGNN